jgi:LPXTG-motif cell wall-anchored protein
MWLARPVYEALPYLYAISGAGCLVASWFASGESWSLALLLVGALALLAGLVIWLRRRDFRAQQAEYDRRSLDD